MEKTRQRGLRRVVGLLLDIDDCIQKQCRGNLSLEQAAFGQQTARQDRLSTACCKNGLKVKHLRIPIGDFLKLAHHLQHILVAPQIS